MRQCQPSALNQERPLDGDGHQVSRAQIDSRISVRQPVVPRLNSPVFRCRSLADYSSQKSRDRPFVRGAECVPPRSNG